MASVLGRRSTLRASVRVRASSLHSAGLVGLGWVCLGWAIACSGGSGKSTGAPAHAPRTPSKAVGQELATKLDAAFNRGDAKAYWALYEPGQALERGGLVRRMHDLVQPRHGWQRTSEVVQFKRRGDYGVVQMRVHRTRKGLAEPEVDYEFLAFRDTDHGPLAHLHVNHELSLQKFVDDRGTFRCPACNYRFGIELPNWLLAIGNKKSTDCVGNVHYFAVGQPLQVTLSVGRLPMPLTAAIAFRQMLGRIAEANPSQARWIDAPLQRWEPRDLTPDTSTGLVDLSDGGMTRRLFLAVRGELFYLLSVSGSTDAAARCDDDVQRLIGSFGFVDPTKTAEAVRDKAMEAYSGGRLSGSMFRHAGRKIRFVGPDEWRPMLQTGVRDFMVEFTCPADTGTFIVSAVDSATGKLADEMRHFDAQIASIVPQDSFEAADDTGWSTLPGGDPLGLEAWRTYSGVPSTPGPEEQLRIAHVRLYRDELCIIVEARIIDADRALPLFDEMLESFERR